MERNVSLYPWFGFFQNLVFWQAIWFLYFQAKLSAADAILLYVVYDISVTACEVPSGYMSDRWGRRNTLILSAIAGLLATLLLATGNTMTVFIVAQAVLGLSRALVSGTDSAMLYESLAAQGQSAQTEAQELRAWRFAFVALAIAAISGGGMAMAAPGLPFYAGAVSFAGSLAIVLSFTEPAHVDQSIPQGAEITRLRSLGTAMRDPVLIWLFVLGAVMYLFSHVPYIFGQPFILDALNGIGFAAEAPLVSGAVSALMMLVSVLASLFALRLRRAIGLGAILLLALAIQICVIAVLATTSSAVAIAILFLRMVPDSLSRPFILARIQPELSDESRATYLSLKSFAARLVFAATLYGASLSASDVGAMAQGEISRILGWYVVAGLVAWIGFAITLRRVRLDPVTVAPTSV